MSFQDEWRSVAHPGEMHGKPVWSKATLRRVGCVCGHSRDGVRRRQVLCKRGVRVEVPARAHYCGMGVEAEWVPVLGGWMGPREQALGELALASARAKLTVSVLGYPFAIQPAWCGQRSRRISQREARTSTWHGIVQLQTGRLRMRLLADLLEADISRCSQLTVGLESYVSNPFGRRAAGPGVASPLCGGAG